MLYFFGWLSFFQMVFLPGYLLIRLLRIETENLLRKLLIIFGLSLITNFIFVFLLAFLHLYIQTIVYTLFAAEILVFLLINRDREIVLKLPRVKFYKKLSLPFFVLAGLVIFRFLLPLVQNLSLQSVFLTGDVLDSWKPWAAMWFGNKIPVPTFHYPQLITANWSLSYLFVRSIDIDLFAKLLMPLFGIGILLVFVDLKNMAGLIITGVLLHYYFDNSFLRDGYVDISFAFFSLLSFYLWLLYGKYKKTEYLFLTIIFALGSLLTKQLGVYIFFLALTQAGPLLTNQTRKKLIKKYLKFIVFTLFLFSVTCFWFAQKFFEIKSTLNIEAIYQSATNQMFVNKPLAARFWHDLTLLAPNPKGVLICFVILLLQIRALFNKESLKIILFIILPFFIFWSLFLNYDQRNLVVIFPFLGYTSSMFLTFTPLKRLSGVKKIKFSAVKFFLIIAGVFLVLSFFIPDSRLIARQIEGQENIGIPKLNSFLYKYYYANGLRGKIATSYYRLCNLPKIGRYCLYIRETNKYPDKIKEAKYLLYPQNAFEPAHDCLEKIFSVDGWLFCGR